MVRTSATKLPEQRQQILQPTVNEV